MNSLVTYDPQEDEPQEVVDEWVENAEKLLDSVEVDPFEWISYNKHDVEQERPFLLKNDCEKIKDAVETLNELDGGIGEFMLTNIINGLLKNGVKKKDTDAVILAGLMTEARMEGVI